jgi:hypothetical protein
MRLLTLLTALMIVAIPASAQVATPTAPTAADSARAFVASARSDLRNLVVAQEAYFADHGRYAPTMEALERYRPSRGNVIKLVFAVNDGWAAALTSERLTGSCTIWVNVPEGKRPATDADERIGGEGEPVCDTQPAMTPPPSARP